MPGWLCRNRTPERIANLWRTSAKRIRYTGRATNRTAAASVWQDTRMEYEHYLDLAHASLLAAEFQAEQAAGRSMSLDQAVDYALNLPLKPEIGRRLRLHLTA